MDIAELRRLEAKATPGPWRYEIQYGPEGEANYAWVYTADNVIVGTFKIHFAALTVAMRKALPELLKALEWKPILTAPKDGTVILTDRGTALFDRTCGTWYLCTSSGAIPSCVDWGEEISRVYPSTWLPLPPHGGGDVQG